jgi:hypothetical protein
LERWSTYTPDGRRLLISREGDEWIVQCGERAATRNGLLDVALIEAMREERDVGAHGTAVDYGQWVRNLADSLDDYDVGGDEM